VTGRGTNRRAGAAADPEAAAVLAATERLVADVPDRVVAGVDGRIARDENPVVQAAAAGWAGPGDRERVQPDADATAADINDHFLTVADAG